jgi:hypothetical protein
MATEQPSSAQGRKGGEGKPRAAAHRDGARGSERHVAAGWRRKGGRKFGLFLFLTSIVPVRCDGAQLS